MEIVSTGGTARELAGAGIAAREIEDFTGFPEMMDGRVKTLHPRLYAGLLAKRDDDEHLDGRRRAADRAGRPRVREPVPVRADRRARRRRASEEIVENIDIGGPTMIRAAAKNSAFAAVRRRPGATTRACSRSCASPTGGCRSTRASGWRRRPSPAPRATTRRSPRGSAQRTYDGFPPTWNDSYEKVADLRYGENPHQQAAFYARVGSPTHLLDGVRQLHGKELSFNNLLDLSSARELVEDFDGPACAIVKHNNPCGCAVATDRAGRLRTRLRVRPAERLRRRDRASTGASIAPAPQELVKAVHRGAARARLRARRAGAARREEERAPARAARTGPRPRTRSKRKPVIGGQLVQTRDVVTETREQMSVLTRARSRASSEWQTTCCSPGRSAATCAPTRS